MSADGLLRPISDHQAGLLASVFIRPKPRLELRRRRRGQRLAMRVKFGLLGEVRPVAQTEVHFSDMLVFSARTAVSRRVAQRPSATLLIEIPGQVSPSPVSIPRLRTILKALERSTTPGRSR